MSRFILKTRAVVLRSRRIGETSKLVTLYSEELGKLKTRARGARKPESKFGAALELLTEVHAVCHVREDRDVQTLSECSISRSFPGLVASLDRLAFGSAALELIEYLTIENEPNKRLYLCLSGVLGALEEVDLDRAEVVFWYFELRVAEALGYRPELTCCVTCSTELEGRHLWFSAAQGGGLCANCGRTSGRRIAGESLRFLARLQSLRAYRREVIPPTPPHSSEIRSMLRSFLEYHFGRREQLKALDFWGAVRGRTMQTG